MSKKNKKKSEEPDEKNKHPSWNNKNYNHVASEIEALRAILDKSKKNEHEQKEDDKKPDKKDETND